MIDSDQKETRMIRLSNPLRIALALLVIALLAACAPGEEPPSPIDIEATVDAAVAQTLEAQGQIATSVALTVAAQDAATAAARPTDTPVPAEPLPTITPILPTATPFTIPTSSGGGGGGGGTTTYANSCDIIRQRPRDNTEFKRTHTFDVSFAILNNGTATWPAGKDVTLLGNPGPTLSIPTGFVVQLPEMKPGDVFAVGPFDAVAPDEPGHYVIDFKLEGGFCYPYVAFDVIR
jgi:hypothetical protein